MVEEFLELPASWQHWLLEGSTEVDAVFEEVVALTHAGYIVRPPVFRRLIGYILTSPTHDVAQGRIFLWAEAVRSARLGPALRNLQCRQRQPRQLQLDEAFGKALRTRARADSGNFDECWMKLALMLLGWPAMPDIEDGEDTKTNQEWRGNRCSDGTRFLVSLLRTFLRLGMRLERPQDLPSALAFYLANLPVEPTEIQWMHIPTRSANKSLSVSLNQDCMRPGSSKPQPRVQRAWPSHSSRSQSGSDSEALQFGQVAQVAANSISAVSNTTDPTRWLDICASGSTWKQVVERGDVDTEHIRRNVILFLEALMSLLSNETAPEKAIEDADSTNTVFEKSSCPKVDLNGVTSLRSLFEESARLECTRRLRSGLFQSLPNMLVQVLRLCLDTFSSMTSDCDAALANRLDSKLKNDHPEKAPKPDVTYAVRQHIDCFQRPNGNATIEEPFRALALLSTALDLCAAYVSALENSRFKASERRHLRASFHNDLAALLMENSHPGERHMNGDYSGKRGTHKVAGCRDLDHLDSNFLTVPRSPLALFIAMPGRAMFKLPICDLILDSYFTFKPADEEWNHWRFKEPSLEKLVRHSLLLRPLATSDDRPPSPVAASTDDSTNLNSKYVNGVDLQAVKSSTDCLIQKCSDTGRYEEYLLTMMGLLDGYLGGLQLAAYPKSNLLSLNALWRDASSSFIQFLDAVSWNPVWVFWRKRILSQLDALDELFQAVQTIRKQKSVG
ncbi:hypothetical protein F1559_002036 [Cyanidiococcus yangmingshanensis]|uniref:Uncharacterized protein n=1 Tax=Cyanidiococcus yangmingshanensis TaxID=2690220 RepID=A0A7J7IC97_9RHOD|nr:hypothetical protein F1559_002036 [Cyanidiococcus yangmingshanensis]